jgi:hypothetical protein
VIGIKMRIYLAAPRGERETERKRDGEKKWLSVFPSRNPSVSLSLFPSFPFRRRIMRIACPH